MSNVKVLYMQAAHYNYENNDLAVWALTGLLKVSSSKREKSVTVSTHPHSDGKSGKVTVHKIFLALHSQNSVAAFSQTTEVGFKPKNTTAKKYTTVPYSSYDVIQIS